MKVRIYKPAKTAMQSGKRKAKAWVMEYAPLAKKPTDPLMGWTGSAETVYEITLSFETAEDAIRYAKEKGLEYEVLPVKTSAFAPKTYADNFRFNKPRYAAKGNTAGGQA